MNNRIFGSKFPKKISTGTALYGQAFRYADLKWGGGKYTNGKSSPKEDVVGKYHGDIAQGMEPLPFVLYVPSGYGKVNDREIPNVKETDNPDLIFTAGFDNGREEWRKLDLSRIP